MCGEQLSLPKSLLFLQFFIMNHNLYMWIYTPPQSTSQSPISCQRELLQKGAYNFCAKIIYTGAIFALFTGNQSVITKFALRTAFIFLMLFLMAWDCVCVLGPIGLITGFCAGAIGFCAEEIGNDDRNHAMLFNLFGWKYRIGNKMCLKRSRFVHFTQS
jgi:hypothetical protein